MTTLPLLVLGGVMALDGTSLGQFMVSRPLVAATLGGFVLGNPMAGLFAGAILELIHLNVLPVGGVGFPETGPASVVAGAAAATSPTAGGLALAVGLGIVWAMLGGVTVTLQRRLNGRLVPRPEEGPVTAERIQTVHIRLILLDFVRGMLLVGVGGAVVRASLPVLAQVWPISLAHTVALLTTGAAISLGALVRRQGERASTRLLLLAGVAGGLVLAAVL